MFGRYTNAVDRGSVVEHVIRRSTMAYVPAALTPSPAICAVRRSGHCRSLSLAILLIHTFRSKLHKTIGSELFAWVTGDGWWDACCRISENFGGQGFESARFGFGSVSSSI